ncbi:MAG: hypothetical protein WD033_02335 [Nitrosopumilaceae archaeon]
MKTVSTKVDSQVYQQLLESCGKSNCSVSEKIRSLLEDSLKQTNMNPNSTDASKNFTVKVNIIPELNHSIKTESEYAIVNGQYFKKCEPLPKAKNIRIIA